MHVQGKVLSDSEVQRIIQLLNLDLSMRTIASRMGCTSATVIRVNNQQHIRDYHGKHNSWTLVEDTNADIHTSV